MDRGAHGLPGVGRLRHDEIHFTTIPRWRRATPEALLNGRKDRRTTAWDDIGPWLLSDISSDEVGISDNSRRNATRLRGK